MDHSSQSEHKFVKVSFICPVCQMTCGWNAKRQIYDAVQVKGKDPREMQYAHRKCAEQD